ncbi:hypothetical protein BGZ94_002029 [Podila epigama]|nr:hypothetical protein BGZ94_002029 [Podila epigama]
MSYSASSNLASSTAKRTTSNPTSSTAKRKALEGDTASSSSLPTARCIKHLANVRHSSPTLPISPTASHSSHFSHSSPSSPLISECTDLPQVHQLSVPDMLRSHLESLYSTDETDLQPKNAFFVADLGEVYRLHRQWTTLLPRIVPYYAVKCSPDPMIVRLLTSLGAGFDCASLSELKMMAELGVDPDKVIHANPCKEATQLKFAAVHNYRMSTFDCKDELFKIKKFFPTSKMLLRISVDDSRALCKFSLKFGADLYEVGPLLDTARDLGIDVIGVCFHVGTGCFDAAAFGDAVVRARKVFDIAKEHGFDFTLLDVGGGFGSQPGLFESAAETLNATVERLFGPKIRVIAEPGRYFVYSAFKLGTQIISRRFFDLKQQPAVTVEDENERPRKRIHRSDSDNDSSDSVAKTEKTTSDTDNTSSTNGDTKVRMYFLNEGIYGSFRIVHMDKTIHDPDVLQLGGKFVYKQELSETTEKELDCHMSSLWGPTMDPGDCLKRLVLPLMDAGDWLCFDNMGAYTSSTSTNFHGFAKSEVVYTTTEPEVMRLLEGQ